MNAKPSLKTYCRKRFNIYYITILHDKETGIWYEEMNGKLHNIAIGIATGIILVTIAYLVNNIVYSIKDHFIIMLCLVAPMVISIASYYLLMIVFYKISKFKVIDEEALEPEIKLSLEKRNKDIRNDKKK